MNTRAGERDSRVRIDAALHWFAGFMLFATLLGCHGGTTRVRVFAAYESDWQLDSLEVRLGDRLARTRAVSEIVMLIPKSDRAMSVRVIGLRANVPIAEGVAMFLPVPERETSVFVTLVLRPSCGADCTVSDLRCSQGAVYRCEESSPGCTSWELSEMCEGSRCSNGQCRADCSDECMLGQARCSGTLDVETCGQSDGDPCLDWSLQACPADRVCQGSNCIGACTDACTLGESTCQDGGISRCDDQDGDGCLEWGSPSTCSAGMSCNINPSGRVASCQPIEQCTDDCGADACSGDTLIACGQYDADRCLDANLEPCSSPDPCTIGSCDPAMGCVVAPMVCDDPPATSCKDPNTRTVYATVGQCVGGTCRYERSDEACPNCPLCAADCTGPNCDLGRIAGGASHFCFVTTSGAVQCWGSNSAGQIGNGAFGTSAMTPAPVVWTDAPDGIDDADAVTAGELHTCALRRGEVWCWGDNTRGQLGDGTTTRALHPVRVQGLTAPVRQIAAGRSHSCALTTDDIIYCWGSDIDGQLGDDSMVAAAPRATARPVIGLHDIEQIAAGGDRSCARLADGSVYCWGSNRNSTLGFDSVLEVIPAPSEPVALTTPAASIAMGLNHACAVLASGRAACWGYNLYGQIGDATTALAVEPSDVLGLGIGVMTLDVAGGGSHTCARVESGELKCWGRGFNGQLGHSQSPSEETLPVTVSDLENVSGLALSDAATCAYRDDAVWCWGIARHGELGTGQNSDAHAPVVVPILR